MPFIAVSVLLQLILIVHVIKTGRNTIWVFVLLFAPVVGGLAYLIVELLPEFSNSLGARRAKRKVAMAIDPNRDLREASQNLAVADTVQNSMILANQHLEKSQFQDAEQLFARSLRGVHVDDPDILLGLAKAQFGLGKFGDVVATLDRLKTTNPKSRSAEGHLLYARAHEELGDLSEAKREYEALAKYYPGPEPRCRLALILKSQGDVEGARQLFRHVVNESEVAGRHYNTLHKEWVALAKREA